MTEKSASKKASLPHRELFFLISTFFGEGLKKEVFLHMMRDIEPDTSHISFFFFLCSREPEPVGKSALFARLCVLDL